MSEQQSPSQSPAQHAYGSSAHPDEHQSDSGAGSTSHPEPPRANVRTPACDHCREKKIRCDRTKPVCVNCRSARTPCTYSNPQKRPSDVSRNLHRFEEVNARLQRIEESISALTAAFQLAAAGRTPACACAAAAAPSPASSSPATTESLPAPPHRRQFHDGHPPPDTPTPEALFLGASSTLSMSNEAQLLAEETVQAQARALTVRDRPRQQRRRVLEAMGSLRRLDTAGAGVIPNFEHRSLRDTAAKVEFKLPSRAEAEECVREYFASVQYSFPIFEESSFREDLDKMYANPRAALADGAWLVCFNMVLLFGIYGKALLLPPPDRAAFHAHTEAQSRTSFYNAWTALDDLEVYMTPRLRNIQALLTMAITAIEVSRPALCWSLISQAARSSQSLGLHRAHPTASLPPRAQRERTNLFWLVYIWSNWMALTFGRASGLPDWDIDVPLPRDDPLHPNPCLPSFLALIALARIQSRIYKHLYSAAAPAHPAPATIAALDAALESWRTEHLAAPAPAAPPLAVFSHLQARFGYLNSLTLLHRAAPRGLAAARDSIRLILDTIHQQPALAESGVLLWLFSCYPFSAFFTIFRAVIVEPAAATVHADLELMKGLEGYFGRCAARREGARRLVGVAAGFVRFAEAFVEVWGKAGKRGRAEGGEEGREGRRAWAGANAEATADAEARAGAGAGVGAGQGPVPMWASGGPEGFEETAAQFLRWPMATEEQQPPAVPVDLAALMSEPVGWQHRLEQEGAQLSFDWFAWEAGFEAGQTGLGM